MTVLKGVLKNAFGEIMPNHTIVLVSLKSTQTVLNTVISEIQTDSDGAYEKNIYQGRYQVEIYKDGQQKTTVGIMVIYADSPSADINTFLTLPGESEITPEALAQFIEIKNLAVQASDAAKISENNAKSYSESASSDRAVVEQKAAQVSSDADEVSANKDSAAASASSAKQSADDSLSSKQAAKASEDNSKQSETNAKASEDAAKNYASASQLPVRLAVATKHGVKNDEVFISGDSSLSGKKVIYDGESSKSYYLPEIPSSETFVSISGGVLTTSAKTYDVSLKSAQMEFWDRTNFTFPKGFTLTEKNQVVASDGIIYRWNGNYPKTVQAGSTIKTSGDISDITWIPIGAGIFDPQYKNPFSGQTDSINQAFNKVFTRLVFASDFGVGRGGDESDYLYALSVAISNATVPLHVVFPKTISRVGSQILSGATGNGRSYYPSYLQRNWGDLSDVGWFSIYRTSNPITLDMSGFTLKLNDGLRVGSFDPTTGSKFDPPAGDFYNTDYQATPGYLVKVYRANNVRVFRGTTDNTLETVIFGGRYGDAGYQSNQYNWWINQSSGFEMYGHTGKGSANDIIYVGETGGDFSIGDTNQMKGSYFKRCTFQDAGRNIISYTGGYNCVFEDCETWRAGNNAYGINGKGSGPASCLDVESEGGKIGRLTFLRCKFMHGGDVAVVGGFNNKSDITNVQFIDCIMHCETGSYAFINYARNCTLKGCTIYGGVSLDTSSKQEPTKLIDCTFYNRVDNKYIKNFAISGKTNSMIDCTVFYEIPDTVVDASLAIFNLSAYDQVIGGVGSKSKIENLRIIISGNSNNIGHSDMGSIDFFSKASIIVEAGGLTGSKPLGFYLQNSSASSDGLCAIGSSLVHFGVASAMYNQPNTNVYYDKSVKIRDVSKVVPNIDRQLNLGGRGSSFGTVWAADGIMMTKPDGTTSRVRVNNSDQIEVVRDTDSQ